MISMQFRIILIFMAFVFSLYVVHQIKEADVKIMDMFIWLVISIVLIVMAVFPEVVAILAGLIGLESPANFVFLVIIFFLLCNCFALSIRTSREKEKLNDLIEEMALRLKDNKK